MGGAAVSDPTNRCVVHHAERAIGEDPGVCWEYDGDLDCAFPTLADLIAVVVSEGGEVVTVGKNGTTALRIEAHGTWLVLRIPDKDTP